VYFSRAFGRSPFLWVLLLVLFSTWSFHAGQAFASPGTETDCLTRDPSTIVKAGDTYWIYGTGVGVSQFSSTDKFHWTYRGQVFTNPPDWVAKLVPENKDGIAWAPDIRLFNGTYYLYYSYSTIGRKNSGIGVATNKTLDPKGWVDRGIVIHSGPETDFNTIDPCIFDDSSGAPWLSFGSYFSGIKIIKIDPATGMQSTQDPNIYPVAEHPQSPANSIEASAVYFHDGYYYLFVNWDACCAGFRSTYNIRIGRSTAVTGPYLDKSGKDMMLGGGSLFLGSSPDFGDGLPFDDEVGPGHAAIVEDTDGYWFSCHYEAARDKGGATTVNVMKLTWGPDGWPSLPSITSPNAIPSGLIFKLENENSGLALYGAGSDILQQTDDGTKTEVWRIDAVQNGYYTLTNINRNMLLSAEQGAQPRGKVTFVPSPPGNYALWKVEPAENGYFSLLNKGSGLCLDDPGGTKDAGRAISLWTPNDLPPQHWRMELQADDIGIVSGAMYKIVNSDSGLCMDDPGGSHAAGLAIGVWSDNGLRPQRWRLEWARGRSYRIVSEESELALSSAGLTSGDHGGVHQMKVEDSPSQLWEIVQGKGGQCTLKNEQTQTMLSAQKVPGSKLNLGPTDAETASEWILVRE